MWKSTNISEDKSRKHNIISENKEKPKIFFNLEKNKDEKKVIKNFLLEKSNNLKRDEEKNYNRDKNEKSEEFKIIEKRDIKTPSQIPNRNSFRQIRNKESNKGSLGLENSKIYEKEKNEFSYINEKKEKTNVIINIEVDKSQLSGNKRTYLYSKIEKEPVSEQNIDKTNNTNSNTNFDTNNDDKNKTIKNNCTKKIVYSSNVEKNSDNNLIEKIKNYNEKKKIEEINKINPNENIKTNNEKEVKINNKIDLISQSKNINNNTICAKTETDNKNIKKNSNENKFKKEYLNINVDNLEKNKIKEKRPSGLVTPNHCINNKIEESKNIDINFFGNTARKYTCNYNNINENKNEIPNNRKNSNNNIKRDSINGSKAKNLNKDLKKENINNINEIKKENNLKTIINTTHKNIYRNNHNYIAIKSSGVRKTNNISQYRPMKTEKSEIINDAKKLNEEMEMNNYLPTEGIPISTFNKIELKQKINSNNNSNNRMNNRRSINDLNNDNMSNKTNSNISNQNRYHYYNNGLGDPSMKIRNDNNYLNYKGHSSDNKKINSKYLYNNKQNNENISRKENININDNNRIKNYNQDYHKRERYHFNRNQNINNDDLGEGDFKINNRPQSSDYNYKYIKNLFKVKN